MRLKSFLIAACVCLPWCVFGYECPSVAEPQSKRTIQYCGFKISLVRGVCSVNTSIRRLKVGLHDRGCVMGDGDAVACYCDGDFCNADITSLAEKFRGFFLDYLDKLEERHPLEHCLVELMTPDSSTTSEWTSTSDPPSKEELTSPTGQIVSTTESSSPVVDIVDSSTSDGTRSTTEETTVSSSEASHNTDTTKSGGKSTDDSYGTDSGEKELGGEATSSTRSVKAENNEELTKEDENEDGKVKDEESSSGGLRGWHIGAAIFGLLVLAALITAVVVVIKRMTKKNVGDGKVKNKPKEKPQVAAPPPTAVKIEKPVVPADTMTPLLPDVEAPPTDTDLTAVEATTSGLATIEMDTTGGDSSTISDSGTDTQQDHVNFTRSAVKGIY